jgi:mono/diheme cytochrome c family protein
VPDGPIRRTKVRPIRIAALLALGVFSVWGNGYAADGVNFGQREYQSHCSVCHGLEGKGDGPYASFEMLKTKIPDLTTLSKKNNGVFPFQRVYEVIDGTEVLKAHGTREMPIWGPQYRALIEGTYSDAPFNREAYMRAHILALVHYISRLQAK